MSVSFVDFLIFASQWMIHFHLNSFYSLGEKHSKQKKPRIQTCTVLTSAIFEIDLALIITETKHTHSQPSPGFLSRSSKILIIPRGNTNSQIRGRQSNEIDFKCSSPPPPPTPHNREDQLFFCVDALFMQSDMFYLIFLKPNV